MASDDSDAFAEMQGWDATITIPEPGVDPFSDLDDESLLTMHPGVLAAVVLAQSNQMRVLDSSIVPDSALVYPSSTPAGRFNEFTVSTPTVPPERFVVINEDGVEEEVVPPVRFYPGLAEREDAAPSALATHLGEYAGDPYAIMLATGTATLQMGVEAGHSVAAVAELFNRVWGRPGLYSADTIAALEGGSSYAEIFGRDRMVDARALCSWQASSSVRSGQLAMTTDDWGPGLHCDFRRIRVAAENFFSATVTMESSTTRNSGSITYFVPSTSLLSADPAHLWPIAVDPSLCAMSAKIGVGIPLFDEIERLGLIGALWPSKDPVVAESWARTFESGRGISAARTAKRAQGSVGGAVVGHATAGAMRFVSSVARGLGRTHMTALSAKLWHLAANNPSTQVLTWMSRMVAVVEVLRLYRRRGRERDRYMLAMDTGWKQLKGNTARNLEIATSDEDFEEMHRLLPRELKRDAGPRSSRVLIQYVLWELSTTGNFWNHTIMRALRKATLTSLEDAALTRVTAAGYNPAAPIAHWLSSRFGALRDFWAGRYGALASAEAVAKWLPTPVRWWVNVGATVSAFRASYMRSISVATDGRERAGSLDVGMGTQPVQVYVAPYHAAAAFRSAMSMLVAVELPRFGPSEYIPDWLRAVGTRIAAEIAERAVDLPTTAMARMQGRSLPSIGRSMELVMEPTALAEWAEEAFVSAASDITVLQTAARSAAMGPVSRLTGAQERAILAENSRAMAEAMARMNAVVEAAANAEELPQYYTLAEGLASDDAWDEFILAVELEEHADHERAEIMMTNLKEARSEATAHAVAAWVNATFTEEESDDNEETGGAVE